MEDSEEDTPQLPSDTLKALQEYYNEKDTRQKEFEELKSRVENNPDDNALSIDAFAEDWNASQFWYSDETAMKLAGELLEGASSESWVAVVSAPSVFIQLRKFLSSKAPDSKLTVRLFEFDDRFAVFKEFIKYDFREPLRVPVDLKGRFTHVICDPPFLSEDCQTRTAITARWLLTTSIPAPNCRLIVCTGAVMESLVTKLYSKEGLKTTTFVPKHTKGLSNEFKCYANFECSSWAFADRENTT